MNRPTALPQLHYTSAAPGPDGSGFRFTAVSETVPANLLREIEQLVGYEPPPDAPSRPSRAELNSFPVAFTHSTLSDGSRLLCHSVYTGADYSGRYGNFHAHVVWLPNGSAVPGGLLPVELWRSPSWSAATPESGRPDPLPELLPGRSLDRNRLTAFAVAQSDRLPAFLADVRALFLTSDAPQLIVAEPEPHDIMQWVALASAALPRELAARLTFTSYTRRPLQATQQIVGIRPEAGAGQLGGSDHRYRVHDADSTTGTTTGEHLWAAVAARVWASGLPHLFAAVQALPAERAAEGPFDPARLAAIATAECVALDSAGRAAAARWAHRNGRGREADFWGPLLITIAQGGGGRTPAEWLALAPLADQLAHVTGHPALATLKDDLRTALADVEGYPLDLVLALLDLADTLSVATTEALPVLAERATAALLTKHGPPGTVALRPQGTASAPIDAPTEDPAAITAALGRYPSVRTAVLATLDRAAETGDPTALAAVVRAALPDADLTPTPHLRLGAVHWRDSDDPVQVFHALIAEAGPEHRGRPTILRTAYRLVWRERPLTPAHARLLVNQLPPDWLDPSGIEEHATRAALTAAMSDPDAPQLAADLLYYAIRPLEPRTRSALSLLALTGRIADGTAAPGFTEQTVILCRTADPVEETIAERAGTVIAERLLASQPPQGELEHLARSGQPTLLTAYQNVAASDTIRDRLRVSPQYLATCFIHWNSGRSLNPSWEKTRTMLLTDVLRPIVRRLPPEAVAQIVSELERPGGRWAVDFQEWNRPGRIARIGGRLLGRKATDPTGHGTTPPGEERRR
ncbi:GTPase-associated protein 1-related protein [Streptomyces albipurpureus]|uniref:GTPase-associated protein 1-related protein n=1 Tax=Streptomyces albipurpureus TaxID=2897419 RepID=A0ABT0UFG6_9ACTN|nr:GTPase-associated protein 1-related protein [Streptomyces sp. CWNU-1]MCM2386897.1 GTPase-associated protein 1-related protein [Streptomyces sp. CWNU-1]